MGINHKLKSVLDQKGISQNEIHTYYNMSYPSFNNKFRNAETRFNIKDLILFSNLTDTKLALLDENNMPLIILNKNDLNE